MTDNKQDTSDLPEEFLQFTKPTKKKVDAKPKVQANSNFIITINPNISYKKLTQDTKIQLGRQLLGLGNSMTQSMSTGQFLLPKGSKTRDPTSTFVPPKLISAQTKLEVGQEKGFVHIHSVVMFEGQCFVDLVALRDYSRQVMGRVCKVQVKAFNNTVAVMEAYINKGQGNPQVAQQAQGQPQQAQQPPQKPSQGIPVGIDKPAAMMPRHTVSTNRYQPLIERR